jgi:hypothetical protein
MFRASPGKIPPGMRDLRLGQAGDDVLPFRGLLWDEQYTHTLRFSSGIFDTLRCASYPPLRYGYAAQVHYVPSTAFLVPVGGWEQAGMTSPPLCFGDFAPSVTLRGLCPLRYTSGMTARSQTVGRTKNDFAL